ncbi:unnamed protein product [Mytilus coruscus]|uniref:B box-type domain-containing protein n=1 Tax=Mytilus coruscus TaxID=42192 RepID=A0A6J8AAL1_MYTCO|nr:unnamed protein product [Mytilus coruscus]
MATNWSICGVCDNLQITKHSVVWCSECDKGLCGECKKHHAVSKASKSHKTVSIAEYKMLPTEVLKTFQTCKLHNEKYELFCRKHDCLCCKKCLKSHNDCKGLTDINEIIKNVKTSNALNEIEQTLQEVVDNIKRLSTNRNENLKSIENKKREIEAEIKKTRINVNHHLDKLQDDLIKELTRVEQGEKSKIENLLSTLRTKEKEITEVQENIASIKRHASELQTFFTMKDIEKYIAGEEKCIQSITISDITNEVNISCQINKSLHQITASVQKFGEINVSSVRRDLSIQKRKDRQAQIMVALPTRNIDNLTLKLQKSINTTLSDVYGCSLLPDDRMVFSFYSDDKIRVLKSDESKDFEIKTIGQTFDVVFIGDDSIAVTSGDSDQINIIDLKKQKLKKSIKINSYNYGVVYKDGHLIYCAEEKGLQMINLNDETITNITNTKLPDFAYVAAFGDKLFYTNNTNDSVTCCDYHGNILWTFRDKSVLLTPVGISVDNDGHVFVVGYDTHNVVVISPNGQRYRQLLSIENRLKYPGALHYDTSTNELLVANSSNDAFLYDVK